jgi:hypothetical protein
MVSRSDRLRFPLASATGQANRVRRRASGAIKKHVTAWQGSRGQTRGGECTPAHRGRLTKHLGRRQHGGREHGCEHRGHHRLPKGPPPPTDPPSGSVLPGLKTKEGLGCGLAEGRSPSPSPPDPRSAPDRPETSGTVRRARQLGGHGRAGSVCRILACPGAAGQRHDARAQ